MDSDCLGMHIISNTPHLNCIWSKEFTSVCEAASLESNWVVSFIHNEHTNDSLVSIDDKVATELMHVFFGRNQLVFCHAIKVAELGAHHYRDFTKFGAHSFNRLVVNSPAQCGVHGG